MFDTWILVRASLLCIVGTCDSLVPDGIPTVFAWGMIALTLLVFTAGTLVFARKTAG